MKKHGIILIIAILLVGMVAIAMAGEKKAFSPSTNDAYDLGQTGRQWKDVHISNDLIVDGTVVIDNGSVVSAGFVTNTVTMTVGIGQVGNDLSVEPGSIFLGFEKISGFTNEATLNSNRYNSTTGVWNINTSTPIGATPILINGIFLRP